MHIPRSDRSLNFIARDCSPGMLILYVPVVVLVVLIGVSINSPQVAGSVALWVIYIAKLLNFSPNTLVLLSGLVPFLHALLQHSNRRRGIGGGRWLLYMGVYLSTIAFACLYLMGLQLSMVTPAGDAINFPCNPFQLNHIP